MSETEVTDAQRALGLPLEMRQRTGGTHYQAEGGRGESEMLFRLLAETARDVIFLFELEPVRRFAYIGRAVVQMLGYAPEEFYQDPLLPSKIAHPEDLPVLTAMTANSVPDRTVTFRCLHRDGHVVWVEQRNVSIFDDAGRKVAYEGIMRDITERKLAEKALEESEARFRRLAENAPDLVYQYRTVPERRCTYVSPAVTRILGYTPEEFYADPGLPLRLADPDDLGYLREFSAVIARRLQVGAPLTARWQHRAGHWVWLDIRNVPVYDDSGGLVGWDGIARDITDRKRMEEALHSALDELRRRNAEAQGLLESARVILERPEFSDSARPIFQSCKQLVGAAVGYLALVSDEGLLEGVEFMELAGGPCGAGLPLDSPLIGLAREVYLTRMARFCNDFGTSQYASMLPEGHIPLDNALYAPMIVAGRVVGLLGLANRPGGFREEDARLASAFADLAALAFHNSRTRESLARSQERFASVVETAGEAIICADVAGIIISWNRQAEMLFGYSAGEAIGKPVTLIIDDALQTEAMEKITQFKLAWKGGSIATGIERLALKKGGGKVHVEISLAGWKSAGAIYFTCIARDLTERKQLELQLLRAHRLEAAGRISGQVAHDFNNLLGPLVAFPELIKADLPEGHSARDLCDTMVLAARQIAEINSQMLALGRRGRIKQEPTNLNGVVEQSVTRLPDWPESLTIEVDLARGLPPVMGTAAQLLRLVTNLVSNARDAMGDIGHLVIKTENVYLDRPLNRYNRVEIGEYVKLSVVDNGCGIVPEIMDKIFDAFFTTKQADRKRGSGLGLSVVQAIVEDHLGYVDLESEIGRGTSFYVYLPACRLPIREEPSEVLPRGHETVLVVDDDPLQREVVGRMLEKLGYRVETVGSGEEAVRHVEEHPVDLLILDMIMPSGIDGAETYERILRVHPEQKAVIVSGFAETERVQVAQRLGAGSHLSKPVRLETLARALRETLVEGT